MTFVLFSKGNVTFDLSTSLTNFLRSGSPYMSTTRTIFSYQVHLITIWVFYKEGLGNVVAVAIRCSTRDELMSPYQFTTLLGYQHS